VEPASALGKMMLDVASIVWDKPRPNPAPMDSALSTTGEKLAADTFESWSAAVALRARVHAAVESRTHEAATPLRVKANLLVPVRLSFSPHTVPVAMKEFSENVIPEPGRASAPRPVTVRLFAVVMPVRGADRLRACRKGIS